MWLRRTDDDLVRQLGGPEQLSAAQAMLVEEIAKKALISHCVGEWLPARETLIHEDEKEGARLLRVVTRTDQLVLGAAVLVTNVLLNGQVIRRRSRTNPA